MTAGQKKTAISILNTEISAEQTLNADGKYVQILPRDVDGVHNVSMSVYDGPDGVGYIRQVTCFDTYYLENNGPAGNIPDGWKA